MPQRTIEIDTADGRLPLYEATPDGQPIGAVVVIQEAFGVNDYIRDVARRFATEGYVAVAPAMFHRTGAPELGYDDFGKVIEHFGPLSDDTFLADVDAALGHVAGLGVAPEHTGLVGFCMGGRVSFLVAASRALGAAVGFYGAGIVTSRFPQFPALVDRIPGLQTPWLGLFGDADGSIPIDDVEALRARLGSDAPAGVDHDIVRYPDAEHGFFCDQRPSYQAEASAEAWPRTLAWFRAHGVG
jgi:carboxymethylenebutenolidase